MLRQGVPLLPFLFIIFIEGLHTTLEDILERSLFRDFVFDMNFVFDMDYVQVVASSMGCYGKYFSVTYFLILEGDNLANVIGWQTVMTIFYKRLSTWNVINLN